MIHFNRTLKSLNFSGKFSSCYKFNNSRTKFCQTWTWSAFLLLQYFLKGVKLFPCFTKWFNICSALVIHRENPVPQLFFTLKIFSIVTTVKCLASNLNIGKIAISIKFLQIRYETSEYHGIFFKKIIIHYITLVFAL